MFNNKKKQLEQQQANEAFRANIRRAKDGEYGEFGLFHEKADDRARFLNISHELAEARTQIRLTQSFKKYSDNVSKAYQGVQRGIAAGKLEDAIRSFVDFDSRWNYLEPENQTRIQKQLNADPESVRKELIKAVREQHQRLCETAPTSADDLRKLRRLVYQTRIHPIVGLSYLPNWNELVLKLIDNPTYDDFLQIPQFDGDNQAWAHKAAKALAERDVPAGKIIIATCSEVDRRYIRPELSNLISDLHKMVTAADQKAI